MKWYKNIFNTQKFIDILENLFIFSLIMLMFVLPLCITSYGAYKLMSSYFN
jgi:hypothetical protein